MGKLSPLATDIFFCVFGVFAMLFALAPREPYGLPLRPAFSISWEASTGNECLFQLELFSNNQFLDLNLPSPVFASFNDQRCSFTKPIQGLQEETPNLTVGLVRPLSASNVKFRFGDEEEEVAPVGPGRALVIWSGEVE